MLAHKRFSADPLIFDGAAPGPVLLVGVVNGLARVNSLAEEVLWRQCMFSCVSRSGVRLGTMLVSVGGSFGLAHLNGIPAGPLGIVVATAFGVALSVMRVRHGFLAVVLVHTVVDLALFSAAARHALFIA